MLEGFQGRLLSHTSGGRGVATNQPRSAPSALNMAAQTLRSPAPSLPAPPQQGTTSTGCTLASDAAAAVQDVGELAAPPPPTREAGSNGNGAAGYPARVPLSALVSSQNCQLHLLANLMH